MKGIKKNMNLKALKEKRNNLVEELRGIQTLAETEVRALNEEENAKFDQLEEEIRNIDATIEKLNKEFKPMEGEKMEKNEKRSAEEMINDYIRTGQVSEELRALNGTGTASAGVTVPSMIGNEILKEVTETSGVINECAKVTFKGTYSQVKRKETNAVNWTDEFGVIAPSKAEYETIEFGSHKCSGLDTISLEIVNQSQFNIMNEVRENLKEEFANKLESVIFKGTGEKQPKGVITEFGSLDEEQLSADHLIDMVHGIKGKYFAGAKWYMNRSQLAEVRKLKDNAGQLLFAPTNTGDGLQNGFVGTLLGKPVSITEMLDGEIIFGNFKLGYKVKLDPTMAIQVLNERFADQGAIGIVGHLFVDGKVIDKNAFSIKKFASAMAVAKGRTK